MAKRQGGKLLNFVAWLTGVLVSLAVGFGMIGKTLTIWYLPAVVTQIAGWVVVVTTLVSAGLAILNK
jgi:hypothetical protein